MNKRDAAISVRAALLGGLVLAQVAVAWEFTPLEITEPPINGTDRIETPSALRGVYKFGDRPSKKMVEHGDTIALADELTWLETPHTQWANRYSEGPVRILWVLDPGRNLRDPIEIRQRSNFDITLLYNFTTLQVFYEDPALLKMFGERYDRLLDQDYDVIVMRGYSPRVWRAKELHSLLSRVYERIDEKVRNGTGLICQHAVSQWWRINKEDSAAYDAMSPLSYGHQPGNFQPVRSASGSPISDGMSFTAWPICSVGAGSADKDAEVLVSAGGRTMIATGRYGKGRVVALSYAADTGLVPAFNRTQDPMFGDAYESVYAVWLRALAWAAGKPPRVALQAAEVTDGAAGAKPAVTVRMQGGAGTPREVTLRYRLTDAFGDRLLEDAQRIALTPESVAIVPSLPALHANGLYRLDLWVEADGATWNWGVAAVRVRDGVELAVAARADRVVPGETALFDVHTGGVAGDLRILAVDGNDRVFVDRTQEVVDGDTVRVDTTLSAVPANRVFFTLYAPGSQTILARRGVKLFLPRIGRQAMDNQFIIASYGVTPVAPYLSPYLGLLYRAAGLNTTYYNWHHREDIELSADAGLFCIGGAGWQTRHRGFGKVHPYCPNLPENREKWKKEIAADVRDFKDFGAISRVLGDERWFAYTAFKDGELRGAQVSQDQWSLALFRDAMRAKYGDIAALNDMWGTDFAGFDDVRVIEEREIQGKDNPSGWLEFREYMNWTYANRYYGWVNEQHKQQLGPDFGSGTGAPHWTTPQGGPTYRGGDLDEMKGNIEFMMLYGGDSPDFGTVGQPGGQKYDPPIIWQDYGAWRHLLTGADALWYYFASAVVGPELAWRRHAVWMGEGIRDVVRGCGVLIRGAEPLDRQVRILSTSENQHMGWLFAKREDAWNALSLSGGRPRSYGTFAKLMDNLFLGTSAISAREIRDGGLAGCRLLILPQQLTLDDATAAAIAAYVRDGGHVVADVMPATRHQMGKPRKDSALAEVFGVDFSGATIRKERESWYSVGLQSPADAMGPFSDGLIWLPAQVSFPGVEPTSAQVHAKMLSKGGDEAGGCFINQYGKGRAMLLNFAYWDLNNDTLNWHMRFGQALMDWADLEPAARVVDPTTNVALPGRPLYAFRRGKAQLLGCLRGHFSGGNNPTLSDPSRTMSFTDAALFTWPDDRHIYNVRSGEYLGFGTSATIEIPSFRARLLCLLPYKVDALVLDAPAEAARGAVLTVRAAVTTDGETPGEHVLYFEVRSPSGARRPLYSKTRVAPGGHAKHAIPFAFNDPAGVWSVTVHDVMTGTAAVQRIRLK